MIRYCMAYIIRIKLNANICYYYTETDTSNSDGLKHKWKVKWGAMQDWIDNSSDILQ